MKILMATMGLDIGGAETHIVELSKELKAQGHDVVVVSNGGVYVDEITAVGIRHYQAPLHRRSVGEMHRAKAILRQVIESERPDVVHAHARIPAFLCGQLKKKLDFAFVTSCHGVYQVSRALRLLSDWGERTLAVSEDIRDYLIREYGIPAQHISVTINGIDTEKFSPKISGERVRAELGLGTAPVLCHVCRLDAFTAPTARQIIRLAPQLTQAVPELRIVIVGGGEVYEELREQAREVNRRIGRDCLVLTGPRTDVNELVAACDAFVGVSRAALEAMSAEKPAVLSGAQGHTGLFTPELLEKAVDTNFCCRTDPVAEDGQLLEALVTALTLPAEEKARLGAYGRTVVREHYSVQRMTRDCLAVYEQVRHRKYRVVMSGYYGFSNAGDDAILQSIQQAIQKASDQVAITALSNDPELTERCYGMDALPRFRMRSVIKALRQCDALISGGGSLLQDRTSTRSILYYLAVIRLAQLMGKPVMLYANGIGPVQKKANRRRVRRTVERASLVTLRDHSSAEELRDMGVTREDLYVTADPVFHLDCAPEERSAQLLQGAGLSLGDKFVAVSVRDWPDSQEFFRGVAGLCDHLSRTYGLKVLFLLMQPSRDRAATQTVRECMEEPSWLLEESCTPSELMGVLGQAKLCLAMRLHTLIFSARVAVPVLGLVYDPKVDSYLRELEMPAAGCVDSFDLDKAVAQADRLMADYDGCRCRLREKSESLMLAAQKNEQMLLELLERSKK